MSNSSNFSTLLLNVTKAIASKTTDVPFSSDETLAAAQDDPLADLLPDDPLSDTTDEPSTSSTDDQMQLYCQFGTQILSSFIDSMNAPSDDNGNNDTTSSGGGGGGGGFGLGGSRKKRGRTSNATAAELIAKQCAKNKFLPNPELLSSIILLTVASALIVFLVWNQRRKRSLLSLCGGRPGMLNPFPIVEPCRFRITYIAFWAMVAYDGIVILTKGKQNLFIQTTCVTKWEAPIVVLINIHIFAVLYFPIVGALSTDTPLGYMIATTWIWGLTVVRINSVVRAMQSGKSKLTDDTELALDFFQEVIPIISMLALCVIFPYRLGKGLLLVFKHKRHSTYDAISDVPPYMTTSEACYVRELLKPPPEEADPETANNKKGIVVKIVGLRQKIYKNRPYFRFSQNILSAVCIGGILIYYIIFADINALVYMGTYLIPLLVYGVQSFVEVFYNRADVITTILKLNSSLIGGNSTKLQDATKRAIKIGESYVWCLFYSNLIALIIVAGLQVYLCVSLLQAYRDDRLRAHRGEYVVIRPPNESTPKGIIGGSVRYMGFQAVMFAWGIIIQIVLFTVVGVVIGYVIAIPLLFGFGGYIIQFVLPLLPALGVTIALGLVQTFAVSCCFTVPGPGVAVDNARGYSNYTYLSFFKSLFVGLVNALLRLIIAVCLGAVIFSRLDMPTVTPKFKMFDYGFKTYEALIHLENAHMHPVLVTFVNMVLDRIKAQTQERRALKERLAYKASEHLQSARQQPEWQIAIRYLRGQTNNRVDAVVPLSDRSNGDVASSSAPAEEITESNLPAIDMAYKRIIEADRRRRCIRFKWLLLRTLAMNPKMAVERKMKLHLDQFQLRPKRNNKAAPDQKTGEQTVTPATASNSAAAAANNKLHEEEIKHVAYF